MNNIQLPILITFCGYFLFLFGKGFYFYLKTNNVEDYHLGGRGLGKWVTALSAQASDMSGWLLMGLPGALYVSGLSNLWIALGLFVGTLLNWIFVARRLRLDTERLGSITLSHYLDKRFPNPGALRIVSSLAILLFFTIYASSGLVASGKLFESMFHVPYIWALVIGTFIIIVYTTLGGFLAVCYTDLLQGILMFLALIFVPVSLMVTNQVSFELIDPSMLNLIPKGSTLSIISALSWGLGYFGQPHILVRFMGIKKAEDLKVSAGIAGTWVFISLIGAILIGIFGQQIYPDLQGNDGEKIFLFFVRDFFNPWLGGFLLAAIMSAIMSTIDSQLLVASSSLTEDLWPVFSKKELSPSMSMNLGRLGVVLITFVAFVLALNPNSSILALVAYAWAGLGATFGPPVLFALYTNLKDWRAVFGGMMLSIVTVLLCRTGLMPLGIYEIIPAFSVNFMVLYLWNTFYKGHS